MDNPKIITVNWQPLQIAEGVDCKYISVNHLIKWVEENKRMNYEYAAPCADVDVDELLTWIKTDEQ